MKKLFSITASILFIVSCGGGGGGGSTPTPTTPTPTVNLSANPVSVLLGSTSTLTWSSNNATSCSASWTNQTGSSGSEAVTISTVGNNSFSITCTGAGGSRSATVTVEGYRNTDGVVVDGYISGAEICIDEDESWTCDSSESSTTSDNDGKFTIKYANGNLVSIGGTDLDSQTLLDNLLITHKLTGHSDFKAVTPVTSVAAFMTDASLVNAALGIDSSIDVSTFDPVANKGDGGVNDYLYEKGNQLTVLAFALQNITNDLNTTTETTQDYFKAITEEIEKEYTETTNKVDIETEEFITKALDNIIEAKTVTITDEAKANTTKALSGVMPIIEVKSSDDLTTSVIRFAVSTLQTDIQAIANGTATAEIVASYSTDVLTYIATDQNIDADEITPDISAIADSASTSEDTTVDINVLANDSYLTSAPITVTAANGSNGSIVITANIVSYTPNTDFNGTDTFPYTITQGGKTSSADVTVTIEAVNDAPSIDSASTIQAAENQTAVTTISISDVDEDDLTLTLSGTDAESFDLSSENVLTFKEAPDYETKSSYSITLSLTDGTETVTKDISVTVTNVNDIAPEFTSETTFSAAENQTAIGSVVATDAEGDEITFTISGTELAITSAGVLTFASAPDFETKSSYTATVTATDGANPVTQDISITVTNSNEIPLITGNSAFSISEEVAQLCSGGDLYGDGNCEVFNITATDPEDDELTYSISGVDKDGFQVTSAGKVSTTFGPNYEQANDIDNNSIYEFIINVSDGSLTASKNITVSILDVNEPPDFDYNSTVFNVDENQTTIGTIVTSDPEGDSLSLAISGSDFSLTSDGVLTFNNPPDYETKSSYTAEVSASDSEFTSQATITVTINNLNDNSPVFTSSAIHSAAENQSAISSVSATDADGDSVTFNVSGTELAITSAGVLTFASAPDYETKSTYTATVTASDGVNTTTQDITVNVTNVNDIAPEFTSSSTFSADENQRSVGVLVASDAEDDLVTFSITDLDGTASVLTSTSNGVLSFRDSTEAPDYEIKSTYTAIAIANDGVNSTNQEITVNINNLNDNLPIFSSSSSFSVDENQTALGTTIATDADLDAITYSISGSEMTINSASGVIAFASAPDYETKSSYNATVTASDGSNTTTQDITVSINNLNDNAPQFTDRSANPIYSSEENSQGQFLGTLTASDADGDSFTFSIDDTATFRIDSINRLFFKNGTDYESGTTSYTPTITVSDGLNSTSLELSITILDVNEPITFTSPTSYTINENLTTVATITATDPEGDAISMGLPTSGNGDDTSLFTINSSNVLSLKTAGNYESKSSYVLRIIGFDEVNRENILQTVNINLNDLTEAAAVNDTSSGIEDDNIRVDVLINDTFISSDVTLTATDGTNMSVEVQNDATSVAEYGHPTIIYSPDANWFGTDSFTYTVSSGGESDQGTVTVTVTSVNDTPTITSDATFSAAENQTAIGTVAASDVDGDTITYSISGSDITINSSSGVIAFASLPDYETKSSYTATVTASDGTNSVTQSITVNVTDVNEAPTFTSSATFSAAENQTSVGTVVASDPEGDSLSFSIGGMPAPTSNGEYTGATINNTSGVITLNGAGANYELMTSFTATITVTDGTNSTTQDITVNITDVNEMPVFSPKGFTINENLSSLDVSSSVSDEDGDTITYSLGSGDGGLFNISSAGVLTLKTGQDFDYESRSEYSFQIGISDGTNSQFPLISIEVNNLNDNSPVFTSSSTLAAAENQTSIDTVTATDADGDTIAYSVSGTDSGSVSINSSTGVLTFNSAPNYESKTSYSIVVTASDGTNSTTQNVTINITNVNEAPAFSSSASFSAEENQTTIGSVSVTDPENATLSYSLSGTDASSLAISSSGVLSFGSAPNYESKNSYSATVAASDGTNSTTQDVTISVTDVNDVPVATAAAYTMNLLPQSQTSGSLTLAGTDEDGDTLTYSIVSNGSHGTASLSGTTITYQTDASTQSAQTESFTFKVNDGTVDSSAATISISLKTDPLYQYQWHLNNTGQTNFATNAGTSGVDLNVDTAISSGYTGNGVTVAVLDSGLEIAHEDLVDNIISGSYDFLNSDTDPTNPANDGDHGTSVAGLIAAKGWNNKGGRGVAPNASLIGYNYLKNQSLSNQLKAWGSNPPVSVDIDIYNMSYGAGYGVDENDDPNTTYNLPSYLSSSYIAGLTNGLSLRNNKGAIYIKSSGNDYGTSATSNCGSDLTCTDMMIDNYSAMPYIIHVGALQANGGVSSYTTPGSALWISGFGGENGNNTSHSGINAAAGNKPAMMTTDQSTCSKGYTKTGVSAGSGKNYNAFNNGDHAENSSCNYTSTFNGTSSAAPTVAGVVALMLEANPALTWRDVKHIIATTADQVGSDSDYTYTFRGIKQYEWETNSAGYKFHNWFGFGKIDAAEAVTTAASYTANSRGSFVSTNFVNSGSINLAINDNGTNATSSLNVTKPSGSNDFVEFVTLSVQLSHPVPKSIGLRLQSPDGTIINVMTPMSNIGTNPSSTIFQIGVAGLYGESIEGAWTLAVNDYIVDSTPGTLTYWGITVYGN